MTVRVRIVLFAAVALVLVGPVLACFLGRLVLSHDPLLLDHVSQRRTTLVELALLARDRGLTEIQLTVYDFNQPALRLYSRLGYAPDSHRLSRKLD